MLDVSVTFIIPVYNGEKVLFDKFNTLYREIKSLNIRNFEIVFINDSSSDQSGEILNSLKLQNIKVIHHLSNQGLGGVYQSASRLDLFENVIFIDLDLSYGIENISIFLNLTSKYHCILASKYLKENRIPKSRLFYKSLFYLFCNLIYKTNVSDLGSGLVLINSSILKSLNLQSNGFAIHFEFFKKLRELGAAIHEVPIEYKYEKGTLSLKKHLFPTLKEVIKISFHKKLSPLAFESSDERQSS